ncbi:hypothetical protein [Streptomyces pseudovenezuelae]|uniref:hypothetical protein n=1 Tax=Streptomyces pseudovenezuelae TaxID=67350 RepID=UPI002E2EC26D|nr:hypothetical protein [Streptomyces pseudovenezuelae]
MSAKRMHTAEDVIAAAMRQGRTVPALIAEALESAQLLQSPETAQEMAELREQAAAMEAAAFGDVEVRLLDPVGQITFLREALAAQLDRAGTLDRLLREAQAQREALAARLRAGQTWQRDRNPSLVAQDYVSQEELRAIFGIELTAPWDEQVVPEPGCRHGLCDPSKPFERCPVCRMDRNLPEAGGAE